LLLHASVKEGWGLVVIEAASQGTPSVVYNVGGLRDSVINGKTGVVIRKNKPEEMAREAIDLLNDSKRYSFYQKDGLKRARSLEWKIAVDQSSKLIESFKK
jgi:glycosyltransferase involved in cell wall biosynthesis